MRRALVLVAAMVFVAGCGASPPPAPPVAEPHLPPVAPSASAPEPPAEDPNAMGLAKVRAMLPRVAEARGLPVQREVPGRVLSRNDILARIKDHVERETPPEVLAHEGEVLAALELVPVDYDFVGGVYRLLQGQIAGYYEPADRTMYLVDDLGGEEAAATLAHELVHALQDQSWPLGDLLKFAPGDGDRLAAAHAVAEGDATSAMLDVVAGSAFNVNEEALRHLLALGTTASESGSRAPRVLQESLTAPYADGFAFVQERRKKGGWPAVDAAWRALPQTTEQLLHPDKYAAREPAIPVPPPSLAALGPGFRAVLDDVMGEQGLQIVLGQWAHGATARAGAAGWGGDHYVVARRDDPAARGRRSIAVGWKMVFDTERDAAEMAAILKSRFGASCRERSALGPITWKHQGRDVAIAAGPFDREGKNAKSAGTCKIAKAWVEEMMKPGGRAPRR